MSGKTTWLTGPTFLLKSCYKPEQVKSFNLAEPELDVEIRPEVGSYATHLKEKGINTEHFQRFSTFQTLSNCTLNSHCMVSQVNKQPTQV